MSDDAKDAAVGAIVGALVICAFGIALGYGIARPSTPVYQQDFSFDKLDDLQAEADGLMGEAATAGCRLQEWRERARQLTGAAQPQEESGVRVFLCGDGAIYGSVYGIQKVTLPPGFYLEYMGNGEYAVTRGDGR
jgi:hypothetical protein